ncbi:cytidine deaminase (plasmid) [Synechocystis sp. PCC 6803]|jgi:cytidine deaminase|uniref:Cytidine deaminase n=1 Tax=Synechocystis sp. (strain ATCC 27184 / PCC 6803 / Kazusa) TaxID=1111708 RepID=Q6YRX0_SYNY3|nr:MULTISPECIES: cytidine deaminase [unclassified Synechocystis]AGF53743.1 cytidine deaminase [Synechocystis sp. PCC 6803]AVP91714.1 cytidine deaminase [Synechocystis sp. IPPAS B-1465]MBD2620131.1 cytidine deaminase [Synechocystis sp. FACHB-898]MBD2639308.1 cytidine deaminase [Synechocystis sp. FACHB-908]MBD2662831.1 cytidine deaminase [Synechocystis sp. FACHB-929]
MVDICWEQLHRSAIEVRQNAYAPYSHFLVGAAGLVDDGRIVVGCNVENASYGLTLCAECGLVSHLIATGGGRLLAVVCVDSQDNYLAPCGRCRQVLLEHGGKELQVMTPTGPLSMAELLPWSFGPQDLRRIGGLNTNP